MYTRVVPFVLSMCLTASCSAQFPSLASRLAAQDTLFEEQYQSSLTQSPENATALGDYRFNNLLDDYSLTEIEHRHALDVAFLARFEKIATSGFGEQEMLSHQLMKLSLKQSIIDYNFKTYEMPISQMSGVHLSMADLPLSVPLDSVQHYEDYISRLQQIPRVFTEEETVLRAGMNDHLMPVKFLLEKIPAQCDGIVTSNPFLIPTKQYPATISAADQQRLTQAITETVSSKVLPAYRAFADFITKEYAPAGRTNLAESSLPDGKARYQNDIYRSTTTRLTADEVHEIGLKEVARIQSQMTEIAKKQGFADPMKFRAMVLADPKYVPASSEQIVDDYRKYVDQMQPKLKELFTFIPGTPVTVEAAPAFQAGAITHYQAGTSDGKRPGRIVVATSDFAHRSLIGDEAIAYHEGIPGHHMQFSVALTLTDLPKFRRSISNDAYVEGWALYSEELGKEVGFYRDAVGDYARLGAELFRAARLVVDTGIHSQDWTRQQAADYMQHTVGLTGPSLEAETDRYIAWPGQALSYKLGQLKFLELRHRAETELGSKFDVRKFHDEMLNGGVLPLDLLDARTNTWIAAEKLQK